MFIPSDFTWYLQDISDAVLADTYEAYMDDRGHDHFSEIFWEANRNGLTLDDLEDFGRIVSPTSSAAMKAVMKHMAAATCVSTA